LFLEPSFKSLISVKLAFITKKRKNKWTKKIEPTSTFSGNNSLKGFLMICKIVNRRCPGQRKRKYLRSLRKSKCGVHKKGEMYFSITLFLKENIQSNRP
jgi:hypothetical protein